MEEAAFINPYNPDNVLITPEDVTKMFTRFNMHVVPNNIIHYQQALTHKSYIRKEYACIEPDMLLEAKQHTPGSLDLFEVSNERLEFLGDTIIKCIFSEYLYRRFYTEDEGFMTRLKTKIEDKDSLARYAKRLGLDHYLVVSRQIEENNGRHSNKLMEDAFEAFMGALYHDLGFDVCKEFLTIILETEIDYAEILYRDTNYKDQLLKFYHSNKWSHPVYVELRADGPIHNRIFTMGVKDCQGNILTQATDMSKKKAEQKCAMLALYKFRQINKDQLTDFTEDELQ
jgi:ribonuclease III